ncbi:sigma-70 family RNA polymerase sigma factor [Pseudonocardiaceae bacterium YIM PH 21723]|nr:sigma-70 family RNA polymerase sigma factor [Pseudonocardiaceae bacterium YIM PH 21723]
MRASTVTEFDRHTDPFRRELLVHCYRMLGSVDEAEDVVQETYLRAWRAFDRFEGRSSVRTWLYRIATNSCLTQLEHHRRRPLPSGLGGPTEDPELPLAIPGIDWLEPFPDVVLDAADPAAIVASRDSLRLALVAALQLLPGRQRAVLILRDVLGWRAAEVAELLGTSTFAVKSLLQRARTQLERMSPAEDQLAEPAELRSLLDRYVSAFENADVAALLRLLSADAELEMPPFATWLRGREAVGRFVGAHIFGSPGALRLVPAGVNGGPGFAVYLDGHAHAIMALTAGRAGITRIVAFLDPGLFGRFGLPDSFPVPAGSALV